jgi:hypothetical protein
MLMVPLFGSISPLMILRKVDLPGNLLLKSFDYIDQKGF